MVIHNADICQLTSAHLAMQALRYMWIWWSSVLRSAGSILHISAGMAHTLCLCWAAST